MKWPKAATNPRWPMCGQGGNELRAVFYAPAEFGSRDTPMRV